MRSWEVFHDPVGQIRPIRFRTLPHKEIKQLRESFLAGGNCLTQSVTKNSKMVMRAESLTSFNMTLLLVFVIYSVSISNNSASSVCGWVCCYSVIRVTTTDLSALIYTVPSALPRGTYNLNLGLATGGSQWGGAENPFSLVESEHNQANSC